jgi:hypothetical protein
MLAWHWDKASKPSSSDIFEATSSIKDPETCQDRIISGKGLGINFPAFSTSWLQSPFKQV